MIREKFFLLSNLFLHPIRMKSCSDDNLKETISGSATTTLGFPPRCGTFASTSPNVRETLFNKEKIIIETYKSSSVLK